ncbi:hypothetical protein ARMGADRAFT_1027410 [Armillaria gallica]|uniref:Uncharacterized protein n=1 Tax=Armillaria gallica TaxID=47427 RepID=A0A2H3E6V7_ARMGA|nr:hypothetical protein ARMGADRAFT_1027410 [Armillaria gallica]
MTADSLGEHGKMIEDIDGEALSATPVGPGGEEAMEISVRLGTFLRDRHEVARKNLQDLGIWARFAQIQGSDPKRKVAAWSRMFAEAKHNGRVHANFLKSLLMCPTHRATWALTTSSYDAWLDKYYWWASTSMGVLRDCPPLPSSIASCAICNIVLLGCADDDDLFRPLSSTAR